MQYALFRIWPIKYTPGCIRLRIPICARLFPSHVSPAGRDDSLSHALQQLYAATVKLATLVEKADQLYPVHFAAGESAIRQA